MSNKILIAIQYWEGDKAAAMRLARLIADLEPQKSDKADILFISRFDCSHDADTVKYVSSKFNVFTYVNKRRGEMWPHGCNELWFGAMDWSFSYGEAERTPPYKAIFTIEADSCPLMPHWIERVSEGWDKAGAYVYGAYQPAPGPHINGNAMFSGDRAFLKWIARDVGGCTPHGGWDYILAGQFQKWGWADAPEMRSWWNMATLPKETFDSLVLQNVVFLHGVKDGSTVDHVRARFLR